MKIIPKMIKIVPNQSSFMPSIHDNPSMIRPMPPKIIGGNQTYFFFLSMKDTPTPSIDKPKIIKTIDKNIDFTSFMSSIKYILFESQMKRCKIE